MPTDRVYLIRHGQTAWNLIGRWQGFKSVPLNETGIAQARALADYWHAPLDAIYSSDLSRAWQTAEALGSKLGIVPTADRRLREHNLGIFQGMTLEEIDQHYPEHLTAMRADFFGFLIPQGESRRQLQDRAYEAFQEATADSAQAVALVSHGGTIKVLLLKLFDEDPILRAAHLDNTSVTTLERDGDRWKLVDLAATPHLNVSQSDADTH
jgi:broad specificity phosphatase PhoE